MRLGALLAVVVLALAAWAPPGSYGQQVQRTDAQQTEGQKTEDPITEVKETPEGGYAGAAKLTRFIQVKGRFTKAGFVITAVQEDGPATRITGADENNLPPNIRKGAEATIDPKDVILEVDGLKIQSQADYATAMNRAKDPKRIVMKIRDCNTGNVYPWYVPSGDTPFTEPK